MVFVLAALTACAGFFDQLKSTLTTTHKAELPGASAAGLSQGQMVGGPKEALGKGVERAALGGSESNGG